LGRVDTRDKPRHDGGRHRCSNEKRRSQRGSGVFVSSHLLGVVMVMVMVMMVVMMVMVMVMMVMMVMMVVMIVSRESGEGAESHR
jgi:hypothetical protein